MGMNPRLLRPTSSSQAAPPQPTLLLMHFDLSPTLLTDSSSYNRTISDIGAGGFLGNDSDFRFGGASAATAYGIAGTLADFQSGVLSYEFPDLSTTDHTIECWLYINSSEEAVPVTIAHFPVDALAGTTGQHFYFEGYGSLAFNDGATTAASTSGFASLPYDQWVHVAAVQAGSCKRIFINGTLVATAVQPAPQGAAAFTTGGYWYDSSAFNQSYIFIDELRVSSRALYCDDFTPPAAPFSADGIAATCGSCCPPLGVYLGQACVNDQTVDVYADGECGETYVFVTEPCV